MFQLGLLNDIRCYYSPSFTGTLLSDNDILRDDPQKRFYNSQVMTKYFALDDGKFSHDLKTKQSINLDDTNRYNLDYGNCTLTCVHQTTKHKIIVVPGIIRAGLCFTMPLLLPDLPANDPYATIINSSEMRYSLDSKFRKQCDVAAIQNIYEHQQREYNRLMSNLEHVPKQYHDIPYKDIIDNATPVNAIAERTRNMLWHQRLIHCGDFNFKDHHKHIDGIPDLSSFKLDDVTQCSSCLKAKINQSVSWCKKFA